MACSCSRGDRPSVHPRCLTLQVSGAALCGYRSRVDASGADVVVRLPAELAFLLRPRNRPARERRLGFDPDATVAHVVRAAGVPPTEVGELRLDGVPVAPDA